MNARDWITIAAILVALGLAAYALIETRSIRKRQYRQALLGDISKWATDLLLCANTLDEIYLAKKLGERSRAVDLAARWLAQTDMLKTRLKYIQETSSVVRRGLHDRVAAVGTSLDKYRELVSEELESKTGEGKVLEQLTVLNLRVRELLHEVSKTRK